MSSEWPVLQLKELLAVKPRNGLYKSSEFQGTGHRWIKMKDVYGHDFIRNQRMELISVLENEVEKFGCQNGDLLFGRTSLTLEGIGDCALVCDVDDQPIFESNLFRIRLLESKADPRFYFYYFKSAAGKESIQSIAKQTAATSITAGDLTNLYVPYPPHEIQRVVARILEHIDDRITLLRETNATLEAIAQALFKSWFVDFDPVRAKMAGRAPEGMDEATATLFPDALEETELGLVPSGWRSGCLGDVAKTFKKAVTPSDLRAGVNYVGLEHIPRKSLSLTEWGDAAELESNKAIFNEGDILFGKLRPYFHKVVVAPTSGVCSTDILVCQPTQAEHRGLATMYLFSDALINYADRLSNGAKMPRVNWSDLAKFPIAVPSLEISSVYTKANEPLESRMSHNTHAARTLATIRDTLLPRLISGQLRLPEAQAQLEPHLS